MMPTPRLFCGRRIGRYAAAAILALAAFPAHAEEETSFDDRLTGDWGGARAEIAKSGVGLTVN
jgi:carbohydrate-selective porin OprB